MSQPEVGRGEAKPLLLSRLDPNRRIRRPLTQGRAVPPIRCNASIFASNLFVEKRNHHTRQRRTARNEHQSTKAQIRQQHRRQDLPESVADTAFYDGCEAGKVGPVPNRLRHPIIVGAVIAPRRRRHDCPCYEPRARAMWVCEAHHIRIAG